MTLLLLNTLIMLIAAGGCLVMGALVLNNPPLNRPPGLYTRLWTYLSTHSAETRRNHTFPELELPCYTLPPKTLFTRLEHALMVLGWEVKETDKENYRLHAIISSSLFKFKDDLEIEIQLGDCGSELHIRSSSRIGRGDMGANTRHILTLLETLARQA